MKRYVFLRYGLLLIAVLLLCFVPWKNVVGTGRTVAAGGRGDRDGLRKPFDWVAFKWL